MGNLSTALGGSFKPEDVPPSEFEPIPAGDYPVMINAVDLKDTSTGGQMLVFEYHIMGTSKDGRKVIDRLNIVNKNDTAERIGKQALARICEALGLTNVSDTSEFEGKKLKIRLEVEEGKGTYTDKFGNQKPRGPQNVVKGFYPLHGLSKAEGSAAPAAFPTAEPTEQKRPWA